MYWYLSFLRPPPVSLALPSDGVVITPQVANDLRTELRDTPTPIQYTWQRLAPSSGKPTAASDLTTFAPPASTYRPITVPLPRAARPGEQWRLGLFSPPASGPGSIPLLELSADPGVLGVWSEGIELKASPSTGGPVRGVGGEKRKEKGRDKELKGKKEKDKEKEKKRDDTPKQSRITRAWPTLRGELRLVEQTSFDLDKKVWDSGLALASWLWRYLAGTKAHPDPEARAVLSLLQPDAAVLELGSGTGLVAIALAQIHESQEEGKGTITATDLASALEIMEENIAYNSVDVAARVLDWDAALPAWVEEEWPRVVIAADVTYNTASFPALVRTLSALLKGDTPLLLAYKQRDAGERDLWRMLEEEGIQAHHVDTVQGAEEVGETEVWVMRGSR